MTKPHYKSVHKTIVPAEWAEKFGLIAIHHHHLDEELNFAIHSFMGTSPAVGHAVVQTIRNARDRLELFLSLSQIARPESEHEQFQKLVKAIIAANSDRNVLLHFRFTSGSLTTLEFIIRREEPPPKEGKQYPVNKASLDDLEHRFVRPREILEMAMNNDPRWLTEQFPSLEKSPTYRLDVYKSRRAQLRAKQLKKG